MSDQVLVRLATIVNRFKLTIGYKGVQRDSSGWQHHSYRFTLEDKEDGSIMEGPYMAGMAHNLEPTLREIMLAIGSDAGCVDPDYCDGFEGFCSDLGYDWEDSDRCPNCGHSDVKAKAEGIYQACLDIMQDLKKLLDDDYEFFIENYPLMDTEYQDFDAVLEELQSC